MRPYPNLPLTEEDRQEMLREVGLASSEGLFDVIPKSLRESARFDAILPEQGLSEAEVHSALSGLAAKNRLPRASFLGAGAYDHYVPASVDHILRRSEFLTAYTPYQPEVAQGTLQVIFEFQSLIADLTGMEIANASLYDGATGAAEACLLALSEKRLKTGGTIVVSDGVDPRVKSVLETYLVPTGTELRPLALGSCGRTFLEPDSFEGAAAVVVAYPNFFGVVDELKVLCEKAHEAGALVIAVVNPVSLGYLTPPGDLGVDVVVGDATCFGNTPSYGGPGLGIFAVRKKHMRKVPGRLAGLTLDQDGKRAYVLTLQAREQHIRRARATSNICTNQGLNALAATVHMALLGGVGLEQLARTCHLKAQYLKAKVAELEGYSLVYSGPTYHEFVVETPRPAKEILDRVRQAENLVAGFDLSRVDPTRTHQLMIAVTERRTQAECDDLVRALKEAA